MIKQKPIRYYGPMAIEYLCRRHRTITNRQFDGLVITLNKCSDEARPPYRDEDEGYCRCNTCPLFQKCIGAYDALCTRLADEKFLALSIDAGIRGRRRDKKVYARVTDVLV
jgi:hypothetical protein